LRVQVLVAIVLMMALSPTTGKPANSFEKNKIPEKTKDNNAWQKNKLLAKRKNSKKLSSEREHQLEEQFEKSDIDKEIMEKLEETFKAPKGLFFNGKKVKSLIPLSEGDQPANGDHKVSLISPDSNGGESMSSKEKIGDVSIVDDVVSLIKESLDIVIELPVRSMKEVMSLSAKKRKAKLWEEISRNFVRIYGLSDMTDEFEKMESNNGEDYELDLMKKEIDELLDKRMYLDH